jgi:hypothetical protein
MTRAHHSTGLLLWQRASGRLFCSACSLFCLLLSFGGVLPAAAGDFGISSVTPAGTVQWSNAFPVGVVTLETATNVAGPWSATRNLFTSNSVGAIDVTLSPDHTFVRLLSVDISTNSVNHFTNLVNSYGIIETVAGKGQFMGDKVNNWQATNEGGFATNANLSRSHWAFSDPRNDNIIIVDEGSSAILKVTPDGRVYTYAGTHTNGFNGDGPAAATNLNLYWPNGGWMRADGTFYILDTYNGKLRKVDTNGIMSTLFTTTPLGDGRALWVKSDESVVYFGSGVNATNLNMWTPTGGVSVVRSDFKDLGNIMGDEATGDLYITDRDAYRVYRMDTNGNLITIAGNGTAVGGGDGFPALATGLKKPRTICFLPNGAGYLIGEHEGGIWYVDAAGIIHRWLAGDNVGTKPRGDGQWFYNNPTSPKVTKVRSITLDRHGNIIIMENNYAYVRRIQFQRLNP